MAITLIANTGSSSKKYALYHGGREILFVVIAKSEKEILYSVRKSGTWSESVAITDAEFQNSAGKIVKTAQQFGCISSPDEIQCVGIRVVAPGRKFQVHQKFTPELYEELEAMAATAPLHIPPVLNEVSVLRDMFPGSVLVAVSDSAFHSTMPVKASTYTIPEADRIMFGLQRYGYHGLSVSSVVRRIHAVTGQNLSRIIVCHLGSGASVTAVKDGVSVDTSMGFSPGSGLPMGSRSGDLETGALLELMRLKQLDPYEAYKYVQTQGGFYGLAGESDIRHLLERAAKKDVQAVLAFDRFSYCLKKQIGSMMAVLDGVDGIVMTAAVGERSPIFRQLCLAGLESLGIMLDGDKNNEIISKDGVISTADAGVKVVVIRTGEMEEMQRLTEEVVGKED